MDRTDRRRFLGGLVAGAGVLAATQARAGEMRDGHAAGIEATPADGVALLPRRAGEAPAFTASLDRAALKATSGGWARELTSRQLPIATGIAAAHLFLNPGGAREMHWHNSAEWAYVIAGRAQATVVQPDGVAEVFNVGPGDLWYFPRGHAHAIQTLGTEPCHAFLAFDDGLYSEHGTFGLSDIASRLDPALLARMLGVPASGLGGVPAAETYIMQGAVLAADGPEARAERLLDAAWSHRHRMMSAYPAIVEPGGSIHVASQREFAAARTMTGLLIRLAPAAMQEAHWHTGANEMLYVLEGRVRATMFGPDKHLAVAEIGPGDIAYVPLGAAHMLEAIGPSRAEIVCVLDSGQPETATLSDWLANAPAHLLANNLRTDPSNPPAFVAGRHVVGATG